ncbi:MAG TPA: hypothetical protein VIX58_07585, partial [Anaerolineae bacterium]
GKGASLLDGYMEDLATDRIYRLMIAQRMRHAEEVEIVDEDGKPVVHTSEFVSRLFDEELDRLLRELPSSADSTAPDKFRLARELSERMIVNQDFDPV